MILTKMALFLPYAVFLSLPAIALMKGKGTVIFLIILFLGLWLPSRSLPTIPKEVKNYKHPLYWAIIFLMWCGLSLLWAEGPSMEITFRYLRLIALLSIGLIAYSKLTHALPETQHHFYKAFMLGYSVYLLFYILEITTNGFAATYNHNQLLRGVTTLSLLLWPYLAIHEKKLFQALILLGFAWLIYGISPDAAFLAIVVSSIIYFAPLWFQKITFTGILIGGVATPWITKYLLNERMLFDYMRFIPTSHQHRIFMWEELTRQIFDKPIFGHGFDFSAFIKSPKLLCNHYITEVLQTRFKDITPLITYPGGGKLCDGHLLIGIHPHNGFLQIWLELGAAGIILFSIFMILFYRSILHNRLAVAMFSFYAVIFSISFNIWQNWIISTLWLGAMCLFVVNHKQKDHI